jgi:DNA processing protein
MGEPAKSTRSASAAGRLQRYTPPENWSRHDLFEMIANARPLGPAQQLLVADAGDSDAPRKELFCAGDLSLVDEPCVSVVGTRKISHEGIARTKRLVRDLVDLGVVVVSGLAEGVDHWAHSSTLHYQGRTIAVIGTPLSKAYPASHAALQEAIYRQHLLISPFAEGTKVFPSNFPARNKVMAALSDATVVIEAGETSGTIHQAAECKRRGRWLFFPRSLVEQANVKWVRSFIDTYERARILDSTHDLVKAISDTPR